MNELYIVQSRDDQMKLINRVSADDIKGCEVSIKRKQKRSIPQNSRLHAIITAASRSGLKFAGKERSPAEWKAIFVSGHAVATLNKRDCELVEGIEGEALQLRESTAQMSVERSTSLMEYIEAYMVSKGVVVSW